MSVNQSEFTAAVLDPASDVPQGLRNHNGEPAGKRFSVYRNNVAASLTDALELSFPVVRKLVGDEFFRAMASVFLRQYQPNTPMLMYYGEEMPEFLRTFKPAKLGYLPDVARLELAQRYAYHAADAAPIDPARLQAIPPDALTDMRLHFAPAVQLVRSGWPIVGIWYANMDDAAPKPEMQVEDALITRPEFDPKITALPPGGGAFVAALMNNETLGQAMKKGAIDSGGFDLTDVLGLLLARAAIVDIS